MAILFGIAFVVYGVGMPLWSMKRHENLDLTDYVVYGFLAVVGTALLIKAARSRRRNRH